MDKLKTILRFAGDRGNITLLLFIFVSLAITWATIGQIEYNYRLEQQAQTLSEEVAVLKQQNTNQELRNEFFKSDYFLDLAARDQLGLVKPGEKVAVISKQDINAILADLPIDEQKATKTLELGKASALEQWYRFFSGKTPL